VTTMVLRPIPRRCSREQLVRDLERNGLGGLFDFLYLPLDFETHECLGYAVVNFMTPDAANMFSKHYDGLVASGGSLGSESGEPSRLRVDRAEHQGIEANTMACLGRACTQDGTLLGVEALPQELRSRLLSMLQV